MTFSLNKHSSSFFMYGTTVSVDMSKVADKWLLIILISFLGCICLSFGILVLDSFR